MHETCPSSDEKGRSSCNTQRVRAEGGTLRIRAPLLQATCAEQHNDRPGRPSRRVRERISSPRRRWRRAKTCAHLPEMRRKRLCQKRAGCVQCSHNRPDGRKLMGWLTSGSCGLMWLDSLRLDLGIGLVVLVRGEEVKSNSQNAHLALVTRR